MALISKKTPKHNNDNDNPGGREVPEAVRLGVFLINTGLAKSAKQAAHMAAILTDPELDDDRRAVLIVLAAKAGPDLLPVAFTETELVADVMAAQRGALNLVKLLLTDAEGRA